LFSAGEARLHLEAKMNSNKNELTTNDVKSNEVNEEKFSSNPTGTSTSISSDLEKNAAPESPKPPEEQVENQSTDQDFSVSSINPLQPEVLKSQSCEEEQGSVPKPSGDTQSGQPSIRKGTGPRTAQGKLQSKRNALKHGLFFKQALLLTEKRSEYILLLNGLQDYWQPQGLMECIEVENLAVHLWRIRRSVQAESMKISENLKFMATDSFFKKYGETSEKSGVASSQLRKDFCDPVTVGEIKEKFVQMRAFLGKEGFTWDLGLIEKIIGAFYNYEIMKSFRMLFQACAVEAREAVKTGGASNDANFRTIMISSIDNNIEHLAEWEEKLLAIEVERIRYKMLAAVIPSQDVMDLLMRYETHISREIDRILNRLERLQRMRKGQPPPPQINLKLP
jgi:hypothetical protein